VDIQRLALARAHFRDFAGMQREAADQLHVEVSQPELAARALATRAKASVTRSVQRRTGGQSAALSSRVLSRGIASSIRALTPRLEAFTAATVRLSSFTRR